MVPLGKHKSLAKLQGTWQMERGQTRDWRQKESPDNEDTSGHPEVNTSDSAEQVEGATGADVATHRGPCLGEIFPSAELWESR